MAKIIGNALPNIQWQDKPANCRDIVWRYDKNPIIQRDEQKDSNSIFNSAVIPWEDGFIGVFRGVVDTMGGGILAYGAIMGASIIGGLFETVLGAFLKPLRRFFTAIVTGTVVLSIGLSLIGVGVSSFGGGDSAPDYGSVENLLIGLSVMVVILVLKHCTKGLTSASCIL